MYLSQAIFGTPAALSDLSVIDDLIADYLTCLLKNGQIYADSLHARCSGSFIAYANLTRPDAALSHHHSKYGLDALAKIIEFFGTEPTWTVLADHVPTTFQNFRTSSFLYLYTSVCDRIAPIYCGDTGQCLPAYLVPIDDAEREQIFFWSQEYKRLDGIWLHSGDLELPAYEQLASPHSGLAECGRSLAQKIETALEIPTYYFLMHYDHQAGSELARKCPGCNSDWQVQQNIAPARKFWHFPYRCLRCRLVSH
jgi:predicted  nucleic acid-binding Zn ribbon protein